MTKPVVVLGGGISGLAAAYRLMRGGIEVVLCEAADRVGGVIRTVEADGFVAELGPNSMLSNASSDALCRDLGLESEMVFGDARAQRTIVRDGRPVALRPGPGALLAPIVSLPGKLRALGDLWRRAPESIEDESVEAFVTRRFGPEVARYLAGPFVSGVYAGDPTVTSMRSAFPSVWEAERAHRVGVIRGMVRAGKARRKSGEPRYRRRTQSFRAGLETLPRALARALGSAVRLCSPAARIDISPDDPVVVTATGERIEAAHVLAALPAHSLAELLAPHVPSVEELRAIDYVPVVSVSLAHPREAFPEPPCGFGALVPRGEGFRMLGCLYVSSLFPARAPDGFVLTTSYVGGALDREALALPDAELSALVHGEMERLLQVRAAPRLVAIGRHARGIPQYALGHHARRAAVEAHVARLPWLSVTGNWKDGVALADCIGAAEAAAGRVKAALATP